MFSIDRKPVYEELESIKSNRGQLIRSLQIPKLSHPIFGVAQFFWRVLYHSNGAHPLD
jgi:hypothetical protein